MNEKIISQYEYLDDIILVNAYSAKSEQPTVKYGLHNN